MTLAALLFGAGGLEVAAFFPSRALVFSSFGAGLLIVVVYHRAQRSRTSATAPEPSIGAFLPVMAGSLALIAGVGVIISVQEHAFGRRAATYVRQASHANKLLTSGEARIGRELHVDADKERNDDHRSNSLAAVARRDSKRIRQNPRGSESSLLRARRVADELAAINRAEAKLSRKDAALVRQGGQLLLNAASRVSTAPSPSSFPPWFSQLSGMFSTSAQILVALLLALVFSRRQRPEVEAVLRPAMLFVLIGVGAALVGSAPGLPGNAQAVLLAYVVAGTASGTVAIGVIAMGLIADEQKDRATDDTGS